MDVDFEKFFSRLYNDPSISEFELDVIYRCKHHLADSWYQLDVLDSLESLRLAAKKVPRNIKLKVEAKT